MSHERRDMRPVFDVITKSDLEKVRDFLDEGGDVEATLGCMSLLTSAVYNEKPEIVQLLLERGADVNQEDRDGTTALYQNLSHHFDVKRSREVFDILMKQENIRVKGYLLIMVQENMLEEAIKLIKKGADVNELKVDMFYYNKFTDWLQTHEPRLWTRLKVASDEEEEKEEIDLDRELFDAIHRGTPSDVRELLDKGANANVVLDKPYKTHYYEWTTPLSLAVFDESLKVVELLLEHGADANLKDKKGKRPLEYSLRFMYSPEKFRRIFELFLGQKNIDLKGMLYQVLLQDKTKEAVELVKHGADMNELKQRDKEMYEQFNDYLQTHEPRLWTRMRVAAQLKVDPRQVLNAIDDGDVEKVKSFLDEGVDVNGFYGPVSWTLLNRAVMREKLGVVRLLLERGADVNKEDGKGYTPLDMHFQYSAMSEKTAREIFDMLLKQEDVDVKGYLLRAGDAGEFEEAAELLKKGDVDGVVKLKRNNVEMYERFMDWLQTNRPRQWTRLKVARSNELVFSSEDSALQYLADMTCSRIKVALAAYDYPEGNSTKSWLRRIADFYALGYMNYHLSSDKIVPAHSKLQEWVSSAFKVLCQRLGDDLLDAMKFAFVDELSAHSGKYMVEQKPRLEEVFTNVKGNYNKFYDVVDLKDDSDFLSAFLGGSRWKPVVEVMIKLENGDRSEGLIDHIIDLEHNAGSVFHHLDWYNKEIMLLLDAKAMKWSPLHWIYFTSSSVHEVYNNVFKHYSQEPTPEEAEARQTGEYLHDVIHDKNKDKKMPKPLEELLIKNIPVKKHSPERTPQFSQLLRELKLEKIKQEPFDVTVRLVDKKVRGGEVVPAVEFEVKNSWFNMKTLAQSKKDGTKLNFYDLTFHHFPVSLDNLENMSDERFKKKMSSAVKSVIAQKLIYGRVRHPSTTLWEEFRDVMTLQWDMQFDVKDLVEKMKRLNR